jgi:hypothetical protein
MGFGLFPPFLQIGMKKVINPKKIPILLTHATRTDHRGDPAKDLKRHR